MSVTMKVSERFARTRWRSRARVAATVLTAAAAMGGVGAASAAAATPTLLSYSSPSRLIQSTGSLHWTSNTYNPFRATPYESFVWRAAKTNTPGHEIELFSQSSTTPFSFGDVTYAQVGGNWYGYFVVNYPVARISRIERIGLTPTASATILRNNLPLIGQGRPRDRRVLPVLGRCRRDPQAADRRRGAHGALCQGDELLARRPRPDEGVLLGG